MKFGQPVVLKGYAIYNPSTEKWSRGGTGPKWSKTPKVWSNTGHLKNHLNQFVTIQYPSWQRPELKKARYLIRNTYRGCVIVDVTTGQPTEDFNIYDILRDYAERQRSASKYRLEYDIYEEQ